MTSTASGVMRRAEDYIPEELAVALDYAEDRFPDYAVGAAIAVSRRLTLSPQGWTALLESIAASLAHLFVVPS